MKPLLALYRCAEQEGITVDLRPMTVAEALSVPLPDGTCAIAMDPWKLTGTADETEKLAHELGHCITGGFYGRYTPLDERGRCEIRAERWAIRQVIPYEALCEAVRQGITEPSLLAEHFEVPERMIRKAVDYYTGPCGLRFSAPRSEDRKK